MEEKDQWLLKEFLEKLLKRKVNKIEVKRNEIIKEYIKEKGKMLDLLLKVDNEYIHIELNLNPPSYYHVRNYSYFTTIFNRHVKVGEQYDTNTMFKHIDLTYNLKDEEEVREYPTVDNKEKNRKKYLDNFKIIEYNLSKITKYYEERNKEKIKEYGYLIILGLEKEELKKIIKSKEGDRYMKEYAKKVIKVNEDPEFEPFLTPEENYRFSLNTERSLGIQEGKEDNQKFIIQNMLKMNYELKDIAKITEVPIKEIEKYQNSIKC